MHKVRAFVLIAQTGSFTKTAEKMGTVQPRVSRMISDLEKDWGIKLFDRSSRGVALTKEGYSVLQEAIDLDTAVRNLVEAVD